MSFLKRQLARLANLVWWGDDPNVNYYNRFGSGRKGGE